jgi:SNF2 family DNA or RNA helicase
MTAVLHGTWLPTERRLFLWGEQANGALRRSRLARQSAHPFQLPAEALHQRLAALPSSGAKPPERELTVWLPSVDGAPLPLRELRAAGVEPPRGAPALAPWKIHGLLLSPVQAVELLLSLGQAHDVGADLRAWRVAALLMLELIVGQQLMPAVGRDNGRLRAEWLPRPAPATARRIGDLARALPPLCRAVVEDPEDAPMPRALVDAFLRTTADTLVRLLAFQDRTLAAKANRRQTPPPTHGELWLAALLGADPQLALFGRGAEELLKEWHTWSGQEEVAGDDTFRITFRLEPPDDEGSQWALSYFLQAADDPSLVIPAAQLWRERGQLFQYLDRRFARPQERLLRGLAFAARLVPAIDRSLRERAPERATLSTAEAYDFLKEAAGLLEQSGFGVLLPGWWGAAGRLRAKARASVGKQQQQKRGENIGRLSFQSMVNFRWELSIGGQPITQAEFERLVALKQPLVRVRGEWVALDPDTIKQAIALFQKVGTMSMTEALHMGLGGETDQLPPGIAFDGVDAEGELGEMLRGLQDQQRMELLPQPAGFHGELRPYQLRGYSWLAFMRRFGMGACLADDMGLGKTAQTIALLLHEQAAAPELGPTLLVCPTSVVGNWQRELARFAPSLRVMAHQGAERRRGEELGRAAADVDVVITSYPLLARDRDTLVGVPWRLAVLDEAQNVKNAETRQAQAARALKAQARVALTGTPVENRLTELWSIMAFLNPGYLGGETEFRRSFARPIERAGDSEASARLRQLTAPFILRRLKSDPTIISDLPEKSEMKVFVPLTQEQATLYEATVRDALAQIQGADDEGERLRRRGLVLAMLTRLKQVCNHPAHFLKDGSRLDGRSGKLERLEEMLEEVVAADDRALIFTQFAEMGGLLQTYLAERLGSEALFLHGGTPAKERDRMVHRFQAPEGPRLFILSLKAGGTGLNLTHASHVFHFDRWWNPAVEDQATDRAFRIGQTRDVQVHKFVCGGTLEEKIDTMIEGKRALAAQILGAGEDWITELSTDQLRDLVALRREEISDERGGE